MGEGAVTIVMTMMMTMITTTTTIIIIDLTVSKHCIKCLAKVTSLNLENGPIRMEYHYYYLTERNPEAQVIR